LSRKNLRENAGKMKCFELLCPPAPPSPTYSSEPKGTVLLGPLCSRKGRRPR
jgi:hypothetical protein